MGRLKSATQSTQQVSYILLTMMMKTLLLFPFLVMVVTSYKYLNCPRTNVEDNCVRINDDQSQCTVKCPQTGAQVSLTCRSNEVALTPNHSGHDWVNDLPCFPWIRPS